MNRAELLAEIAALPSSDRAPSPWASRVVDVGADWLTTPPPKRDWFLRDVRTNDGVLPRGKCGLLIGEGGVSKTMAAVQLAYACATASPWLGTYAPTSAGRVLLVLGEEDSEEVQRRLFNAARCARLPSAAMVGAISALPLAGVPCPLVEMDGAGNLSDAPFLHWLRSHCAERRYDLVVLDPLARFAGHDAERDNAAATRVVQACESVATASGATVIVVHHTAKMARGGAEVTTASARGATAITDGVRWVAALSAERIRGDVDPRLAEVVTFAITKSNYAPKGDAVALRRDRDFGGALVPLDEVDREMVREAMASADPGELARLRRQEATDARAHSVATVIRSVLFSHRDLSRRALFRLVAGQVQCGEPIFDRALALLGDSVQVTQGPNRTAIHNLVSEGVTRSGDSVTQ